MISLLLSRRARRRRPSSVLRLESLEGRILLNAGDLDATFGVAGVVAGNYGATAPGPKSIVVQSDGKIVVGVFDGGATGTGDFRLVRYNPDGALDTSFGGTGVVHTDFGGGRDNISQLILETTSSGDKILAVGTAVQKGGQGIGLARYNMDGTLDASFGGGGKVFTHLSGKTKDSGASAIIDPSGRIIVSGSSYQGKSGSYTYANVLVRYNAKGSLDSTFGGGGKVVGAYGKYTYDAWGPMEILGSGAAYKIGVLGKDGGTNVIARFNANGSRDTTFGPKGEIPNPGGSGSQALSPLSVAFQPDGKIVDYSGGGNDDLLTVLRYNGDGSPDTSFGVNGQVAILPSAFYGGSPAFLTPSTVGFDAAGRIVVAGRGRLDGSWWDSILVRFTSNGALDASFGNNGAVTTRVGGDLGGEWESYQAIAFQPDGKILAGGYYTTSYDPNTGSSTIGMDVVRYDGDAAAMTAGAGASSSISPATPIQSADSSLVSLALEEMGFLDSLLPTRPGRSKRSGA